MPAQQAKHWCFTINNYDEDVLDGLKRVGSGLQEHHITYLVFGKEQGEKATPHLQGYVAFDKRRTLGAVKKVLGGKAHLECMRGTPTQASDYCKKDGDFSEFGEIPEGRGSRSDLRAVVSKVQEGASMREIAEEHPETLVRYGGGVLRLKRLYPANRDWQPQIWVFWGKTGSGKTRRVYEFVRQDDSVDSLWTHPGERWFDGYDGHRAVLFDDFDGGWFKLSYLLRLLDRYPMRVPVKGDYVCWVPRTIYITSNIDPKKWYENAHEEHQRALHRRLTEFGTIIHMD